MENIITLKDIVVEYGREQVLKSISLDIKDKEFITLLGPSGCGKTTTLRVIGGFLTPKTGDVIFGGERINDVPLVQAQRQYRLSALCPVPPPQCVQQHCLRTEKQACFQGRDPAAGRGDAGACQSHRLRETAHHQLIPMKSSFARKRRSSPIFRMKPQNSRSGSGSR